MPIANERFVKEADYAKASSPSLRSPEALSKIVSVFASYGDWMEKVRLRVEQRWYERLYLGPDYDIWVISWLPGQSTGFHDHGASSGAFIVATGVLEEHRPGEKPQGVHPGEPLAFGPDYVHNVRNASLAPAVSIHAYSPPLNDMNEYELDGGQLVPRTPTPRKSESIDQDWRAEKEIGCGGVGTSTIEDMLSAARARLRRLSPEEARQAMFKSDTVMVDIRPQSQRALEGSIPGALIVERNVLEWRFDPTSASRLPAATGHNIQVIVFCSEGYTSSLAAAALQDLGLWRATDVIGGFQAWRQNGLPIVPSIQDR